MKKINRPLCVKEGEIFIAENVYNHEAYIYRFINLLTGMIYLGYHLGDPFDEYWHSSTCEEFAQLFASSQPIFRYEIMTYGTKSDMQNKEHQMLKEVDARNNPLYYNKSNGSPANVQIREDLCNEFIERYYQGEFNIGKKSLEWHISMAWRQIRDALDKGNIIKISDELDLCGGNSDNCDPVLVFEKILKLEDDTYADQRINGNHTVQAGDRSKHCIDLPTAFVPKSIWKGEYNFSDVEIGYIALLLNKKERKVRKANSNDTIVKWLVNNTKNYGIPVSSSDTTRRLKELGLTTKRERNKVIKDASNILREVQLYQDNQVWIDYSIKANIPTYEAKVASYNTEKSIGFGMSSGISQKAYYLLVKYLRAAPNKELYVLVIYHNTPDAEEKWNKNELATVLTDCQWLLNSMKPIENEFGVEINRKFKIVTMDTTQSDGQDS